MHSLLQKLLGKKGITSPEELTPEERATFEQWKTVLAKEELTLDDIKTFCRLQLDVVEGKWTDLSVDQDRKAELIPYHTVYRTILAAISAPRAAREALEKHLLDLTK